MTTLGIWQELGKMNVVGNIVRSDNIPCRRCALLVELLLYLHLHTAMLRVGQATNGLHRVGGLLLLRGTDRVRVWGVL